MSEETELLREIRDVLLLIAEPAIAKRDEKFREQLVKIVGKSKKLADSVKLMDGSRAQAQIKKETQIDAGNLSRLVKSLREAGLIEKGDLLKLKISIPGNFFDNL